MSVQQQTREQQLEQALKDLIGNHFYSKQLEWKWQEGHGLQGLDFELYARICSLIPDTVAEK